MSDKKKDRWRDIRAMNHFPERRSDIDWLRVLAVLLLIPYHTAVIFTKPYVSYIKAEPSTVMDAFAHFMNQWHMPLFFLVSGAATWFSLGSRTGGRYVRERIRRLIVPLIFGSLAIVPIQVYFQRRYYHEFSGSYIQFYPHMFDGIYPHGNFTWGQLWFLAYLFVFSLLALPLFLYLKTEKGQEATSKLAALFEKPGAIFLAAIPFALIQSALRARWPGFQNLYNDWANFCFYFTAFTYGYIMCSDVRFAGATERNRRSALILGVASMALIVLLRETGSAPSPDYSPVWMLYMLLHGFSSWCWLVAFLGFARRHLNFEGPLLNYATEAALPFYILHHAVIVTATYYVIRWNVGVAGRFTVIALSALIATVAIFDLLVRRWRATRLLFGMKPRKILRTGKEAPALSK